MCGKDHRGRRLGHVVELFDKDRTFGLQALHHIFVVDDLEIVRAAAKANGGYLKPIKQAWRIRGFIVLDGSDPEGNVIQFKQLDTESQ